MNNLQFGFTVVGTLFAVSYLVTQFLGGLILNSRIHRDVIAIVTGICTLVVSIAYGIIFGWNVFLVIAVCCWVPSLIMTSVELKKELNHNKYLQKKLKEIK